MKKFGKVVVKLRIPILVLSFLLLIPSVLGYFNTRVNYDILYYLPSDIDTMQGQDILLDDFGKGAYAMVVVDGMNKSNVSKLVKKVEGVDHVASVISYSGIVGDDVPSEILPDKFRSYFENEDSGATLFAIFFDDTTSSDDTMKAIQEVRDVTDNQCYIAGMSAVVTDTKTMAEKETPFYVLVAVVLVCIVLAIFMDSFLVPVFFMLSIGMAIVYNLGSNYFLGEVSYITKALAAVLQLGVTLDYSIFLWHSYKEAKEETPDNHQEAMAVAIGNTLTSVVGSSITTVAGFIALCFMSFTLGLDLGVVMATATLKDSSGTLADGVTQLNEGAITLKDGMAQFNSEAIEPITKLVDSDAQTAVDTIKAVVKAGQEYNSFLGKSDDKAGSVTFVYKTAGITANN